MSDDGPEVNALARELYAIGRAAAHVGLAARGGAWFKYAVWDDLPPDAHTRVEYRAVARHVRDKVSAERRAFLGTKPIDAPGVCLGCGGPHRYDATVPSPLWNRVVRAAGGPEHLCAACVLLAFARAGEGFTATLWGVGLDGVAITVGVGARDALGRAVASAVQALETENTALRAELGAGAEATRALRTALSEQQVAVEAKLSEIRERLETLVARPGPGPAWPPPAPPVPPASQDFGSPR